MPISGTKASAIALHILGGTPLELSLLDLANYAGERLMSAWPWRWADGTSTELAFTLGQSFVALPIDVRALIAVESATTDTWIPIPTTHREILRLRSQSTTTGPPYWWCLSNDSSAEGAPVARLELYPTPTANLSPALRIWYTRSWTAWTTLTEADDARIPEWLVPLYIEFVKATADGFEKDADTPILTQGFLAQIRSGPDWLDAVRRDGMAQPTVGRPIRGMMPGPERIRWPLVPPIT